MFPILCKRDLLVSVNFETMRNDSISFLQAHMGLKIKESFIYQKNVERIVTQMAPANTEPGKK